MSTKELPDTVFHYTSADGLLSILEHRQLWVTDIEFLNDAQELRFGVDLLRRDLERRRDEAQQWDPDAPTTQKEWGRAQSLLTSLEKRFPTEGGSDSLWEYMPYVACFCRDGDLLSMWRGYGQGPGFSIEFKTKALLDVLNAEFSDPLGEQHEDDGGWYRNNFGLRGTFQPIEYGDPGAGAIVDEMYSTLDSMAALSSEDAIDLQMPRLARIKHAAFAEETEVRLTIFRNGELAPPPRLRSANGHLVPYLPISFPREAISSITVGPSTHRKRSYVALGRRFSQTVHDEYQHVELRTSAAPLV